MTAIDLGKVIEDLTFLRGTVISTQATSLFFPIQEYQILKDRINRVCAAMDKMGFPVLLDKARKLHKIILNDPEQCDAAKIPAHIRAQFPQFRVWMMFRFASQNSWRDIATDLKKGYLKNCQLD